MLQVLLVLKVIKVFRVLQELGGPGGSTGPTGPQGAEGNFGGPTFYYTFEANTTDANPGAGDLRLDNLPNASTGIYILILMRTVMIYHLIYRLLMTLQALSRVMSRLQ